MADSSQQLNNLRTGHIQTKPKDVAIVLKQAIKVVLSSHIMMKHRIKHQISDLMWLCISESHEYKRSLYFGQVTISKSALMHNLFFMVSVHQLQYDDT